MGNTITLVIAAILACISFAGAISSTVSSPGASLTPNAAIHRTASPTFAMEVDAVTTVICNDDCFGVDRADIVDAVNYYCNEYGYWTFPTKGNRTVATW